MHRYASTQHVFNKDISINALSEILNKNMMNIFNSYNEQLAKLQTQITCLHTYIQNVEKNVIHSNTLLREDIEDAVEDLEEVQEKLDVLENRHY